MKSTSTFNFDTPRIISFPLKARFFFKEVIAIMGFCFFFFGMIFPIIFGSMADYKSVFVFKDNDPVIKGMITDKIKTGSQVNKHYVYQYDFSYNINGKAFTNTSFTTARGYELYDSVIVQYKVNDPGTAKIQSMKAAPFDFWIAALTTMFPLIGLIFLIIGIKRVRKNIRLVETGIFTTGKVIRKEPTMTKINKQTVYKIFFQFKLQDQTLQEAFVKTHRIYNLGDEAQEPLVYDPNKPSDAILLDMLPEKIRPLLTT